MKIVYLAPFGIRPKGTLIARTIPLAAELQRLGHEVVIIAPPYTNPEDSGKVKTIRGVKIHNITLSTKSRAVTTLILSWRMFKAIWEEKPDIVHLFKPKGYGGLAAMLLVILQRFGIRLPSLFVDCDDWEGKGGMNSLHPYKPAEKIVFRFQETWLPSNACGVTVASRTLQTKIWGMGVAPKKVLYLPNCADDAPTGNGSYVREKLGIPIEVPLLLLYTRFFEFSQEKLHYLFTEIYQRVPNVRFLVVGKGSNNEEDLLIKAGRDMGFSGALVMGGWLNPEEIPDYLAAGDVAIYPFSDNLINRSKCPAKLTELLRAGAPVVADRVGQLAEYVKEGESGILSDPNDWLEMADRTVELLLQQEKRRCLGEAGRQYLLARFKWKDYAAKLALFYKESLEI